MEADLERLRRDRGEGDPVKLVTSTDGKEVERGVVVPGQPIEIRLGGGEGDSGEDSDDVPGEREEGQGSHVTNSIVM